MHPGRLDSLVGDGIKVREHAIVAMASEAFEEAGVPEELSASHLRSCGIVSYHLSYSFLGNPGSFPCVLYTFEMEVPADFKPSSTDSEVSEFVATTESRVINAMAGDDFKPNVRDLVWLGLGVVIARSISGLKAQYEYR